MTAIHPDLRSDLADFVGVLQADDYDQWMAERRLGLGGSDIAAILGLDPWKSPMQVYAEKVGRGRPVDPDALDEHESEAMRWGNLLEPVVAAEAARRRDLHPVRVPGAVNREHPWMRCNIDRAIFPLDQGDLADPGVLEVKTTDARRGDEWAHDEVPAPALAQTHWAMIVTGWSWGLVAGLVGGNSLQLVDVKPDPELHDMIRERAEAFWTYHVLGERPPPPGGRDLAVLDRLYDLTPGRTRPLTSLPGDVAAEVWQLVGHYRRVRRLHKALGDRKDETKARLAQLLGEHDAETVEYHPDGARRAATLLSWKRQHRMRVNVKAMRAERPHWAKEYEEESDDRSLYVTTRKEL